MATSHSYRRPGKMLRLLQQLRDGLSALCNKPAQAVELDRKAAWKACFDPFCHLSGASGAEWACNGQGNWQLLETHGMELEAAVLEILDQYWVPKGIGLSDTGDKVIHAHSLTALYQLGMPLTVEYFCGADETDHGNADPCRFVRAISQHGQAECAYAKQQRERADRIQRAFQRDPDHVFHVSPLSKKTEVTP